MQYQIEIREIEPIRVAYTKYRGLLPRQTKYSQMFSSQSAEKQMALPFSVIWP